LQQSFQCPKCGVQIPVGQSFCVTCGQRFEYRCRHCGTTVADASGFCTSCGGKLSSMPQQTPPEPHKAVHTYHRQTHKVEHTMQRPIVQIGRYMIIVAVILFMVGIIYYIGSSTQVSSSNWLGGYSFGGQSPPSTPPVTDDINTQQTPNPTADLPSYTMNEVIAAARQMSPECRLQTRRTG
jgi:Double zinc ribbon